MKTHVFDNTSTSICTGCCVPMEAIEDGIVGPECLGPETYSQYKAHLREDNAKLEAAAKSHPWRLFTGCFIA